MIKSIDVITNAHKSPKGWILEVFPFGEGGNWGSEGVKQFPQVHMVIKWWIERDRVVWGMVPEAFSGLLGNKLAISPSSNGRDHMWCHLLISSINTVPSMHFTWTASSWDIGMCPLLARLISHLLQEARWLATQIYQVLIPGSCKWCEGKDSLQMWLN